MCVRALELLLLLLKVSVTGHGNAGTNIYIELVVNTKSCQQIKSIFGQQRRSPVVNVGKSFPSTENMATK